MANKIIIEVAVDDKGSLKIVANEADAAAGKVDKLVKSTDKLKKGSKGTDSAAKSTKALGTETDETTKKRKKYSKGEKGVAQAGMNSTKAFSKLRNEIGGGGGGLVGAYAGLAANIFALTATFGALARAARATQLEQGLVAMGKASGLAMHTLSQGLVEATGHAISLEEAMRSTALITSAGIDPSSIERFGEVARKASAALGRDVQDSISRLTRGVTKLEPELLDELGIMVRLDEATKTYADSIGKQVSELTNFEKRQAFLNATLEEGEKKFGALGDVDVNAYDKLAAAFANITKSGIGGLADTLASVVGYLAESPVALMGAIAAFAATISGQVLGSLTDMSKKTALNSKNMQKLNADTLRAVKPLNLSSKALDNVITSMNDGNVSSHEYKAAMDGQVQSQRTNLGLLNKRNKLLEEGAPLVDEQGKALKKTGISQDEYNRRMKNSKKIMKNLNIAQSQGRNSSAQLAAAKAQAALAEGRFGVALKNTKRALRLQGSALKIASREALTYAGALNLARIAASGLAMAAKTAGAAIMSAMGFIGMAMMAFTMLKDAIMWVVDALKSEAFKEFEAQEEKLIELTKELAGNVKELNEFFDSGTGKIQNTAKAYEAMANTLSTFTAQYNKMNKAGEGIGQNFEAKKTQVLELVGAEGHLHDILSKNLGVESVAKKLKAGTRKDQVEFLLRVEEGIVSLEKQGRAVQAVGEAFKKAKTPLQEYATASAVKTELDTVTDAINNMRKSLITKDDGGTIKLVPKLAETSGADITKTLTQVFDDQSAVFFNVGVEEKQLQKLVDADAKAQKAITDKRAKHEILRADRRKYSAKASVSKEYWKELRESEKKIEELKKEKVATTEALDDDAAKELKQHILESMDATTDRFNIEQKRLQLSKKQEQVLKNELALKKQEKSHTLTSINERMAAEEDLRALKEAEAGKRIEFLKGELKVNRDAGDEGENALERRAVLEEEIKIIQKEQKQLQLQALTIEEQTVKRKKTLMSALKEEQSVEKAILDIAKKKNKAKSEELTNSIKIAKLNQSIANRKAGIDSKLLPSQIALIEQDDEVLKKKVQGMVAEAKTKKASLKLEQQMAKIRLEVLRAEVDVINQKRKDANKNLKKDEAPAKLINTDALTQTIEGLGGTYEAIIQNVDDALAIGLGLLQEQVNSISIIDMQNAERLKKEIEINSIFKSQLDVQKEILGEIEKQFAIRQKIKEIANTDSAGNVASAYEAAKIAQENRNADLVLAKAKHVLAVKTVKAENALLEAKWHLLHAEMSASGGEITQQEADVLNASRTAMRLQKELNDAKIETAEEEIELVAKRIKMEEDASHTAAGKAGGWQGFVSSMKGARDAEPVEDTIKDTQAEKNKKPTADAEAIMAHQTSEGIKAATIRGETNRLLGVGNSILTSIEGKLSAAPGAVAKAAESTDSSTVAAGEEDFVPASAPGKEASALVDRETKVEVVETAIVGDEEKIKEAAVDESIPPQQLHEESKPTGPSGATGPLEIFSDLPKLGEIRGALQGVAKDMADLGPDGEGASQMILGMDNMIGAFEDGKLSAESIGAGIGALSQIIGGAAKHKVRGIDKEIAAEKKRDGKSKESLAKIKALEKKKEAVERKAFETRKKMQMAGVVISTASAIMKEAEKGFPQALPGIALWAAMGAAQLAMISSTSYQGGGSINDSVGKPSSVSVGKRKDSVDVAKSQSAKGELAYFRGERGYGGPENFRSAFTGVKHRAPGGSAGYIVGEQGPELFMPNKPGTIVPSDDTAAITGQSSNITFNINTVDATGVEELLEEQQGNIIGMIRQAANSYGQEFMEDIDTTPLNLSRVGRA